MVWYTNHTPEEAQCPGVVGQQKQDSGFCSVFLFKQENVKLSGLVMVEELEKGQWV